MIATKEIKKTTFSNESMEVVQIEESKYIKKIDDTGRISYRQIAYITKDSKEVCKMIQWRKVCKMKPLYLIEDKKKFVYMYEIDEANFNN